MSFCICAGQSLYALCAQVRNELRALQSCRHTKGAGSPSPVRRCASPASRHSLTLGIDHAGVLLQEMRPSSEARSEALLPAIDRARPMSVPIRERPTMYLSPIYR